MAKEATAWHLVLCWSFWKVPAAASMGPNPELGQFGTLSKLPPWASKNNADRKVPPSGRSSSQLQADEEDWEDRGGASKAMHGAFGQKVNSAQQGMCVCVCQMSRQAKTLSIQKHHSTPQQRLGRWCPCWEIVKAVQLEAQTDLYIYRERLQGGVLWTCGQTTWLIVQTTVLVLCWHRSFPTLQR